MSRVDERDNATGAQFGPHLALARLLLTLEAGERRGSHEIAEAAEVVCGKLRRHLGRRIGPAGFDSLLARALHLSKRRFPFLEGIRPEQQGGDCLEGVRESVQGRDPAEVSEGLAALLASFLWLLSLFIGEDMALRQVARLWPEVPILDIAFNPKETGK